MKVSLSHYKYARYTASLFGIEEMYNLSKDMDYAFFASPSNIPNIDGVEIIQKKSAWLSVCKDDDEQINNYQSTCRNEVRRSLRTTEFSIEINSTPIEELYDFHSLCEHERNWYPVPKEELTASFVICVRYLDELIAGMTAYCHRDFLRVGRIFSRRKSLKYQNLQQVIISSASRRVVHEYTKLARERGFSFIDLGGVSFEDETKLGITKYKMSFGSEVMPMNLARIEGSNFEQLADFIKKNGWDLT